MRIETLSSPDECIPLLEECGLPVADIAGSAPIEFFGLRVNGKLAALAGLELHPPAALLRSVAVSPAFRGQGFASELVAFAESIAAARQIETLFLLTASAEGFFRKLGYDEAQRAAAPDAIRTTPQFASLCPSSATFMAKPLPTRTRAAKPTPAKTPPPPYYAVIFTSLRTDLDAGYAETAKAMLELAAEQPGFLGFETARQELGISVSYWASLDAIAAWKANVAHRQAQRRARDWYKTFRVRVCRVEREHGF